MNLKNKVISNLFLITIAMQACASKPVTLDSEDDAIVKSYLQIHGEFVKQSCTVNSLEDHQKLLKAYRGTGYYIPEKADNQLDVQSLIDILPLYKEKIEWINSEKLYIQGMKKLPNLNTQKQELHDLKQKLLSIKYEHYYATDIQIKKQLEEQSKVLHQELFKKLHDYLEKVSFLRSFRFPVDHLFNRAKYDTSKTEPSKKKTKYSSHYMYLLRKIVEDGAQDKDHTKPDTFLRSAIDTLYLELKNEGPILSENSRFDLNYVLSQIDKELDKGKGALLERLTEWSERTQKTLEFYEKLIADAKDPNSKTHQGDQILKKLSEDRFNLSDFTYKKQRLVYEFWMKQPELMKSIYVLESILYNEVGSLDGRGAPERRDVAQVVWNRYINKSFNHLPHKSSFHKYLVEEIDDKKIDEEKWLNVMFKEGEFSFTYYFIPSSYKIFCPDVSRSGKFLQKENIKIALDALRKPRPEFEAIRYFSRASMIGRIDMTTVWKENYRMPEGLGEELTEVTFLKLKYKQNKYEYLYSFKNAEKEDVDVLQIGDEIISIFHKERENPRLFGWRNPHYFIYFKKN